MIKVIFIFILISITLQKSVLQTRQSMLPLPTELHTAEEHNMSDIVQVTNKTY